MSFTSIADLPVVDDLNVPVDPAEYAEQANPAPAAPGIYRFQVTKIKPKTNKDGSLLLQADKFPVLTIDQVKIVEPAENERLVGVFTDVRTKPGTRKNAHGADVVSSDLYDLLFAYDRTQTIEGFEHAKQLLQQFIDSNATFVAGLGWEAFDSDYVEAEFGRIGNGSVEAGKQLASKDVANAIYNKARKRTKDFIKDGKRVASIQGPSGMMLEAKPKLTRYYPSHGVVDGGFVPTDFEKLGLGPFKSKK